MVEEKLFENLPVQLNLGDSHRPTNHIGWADAFRNVQDETIRIEIRLDPEASKALQGLDEVFDLKAIAFAGMKRKPRRYEI